MHINSRTGRTPSSTRVQGHHQITDLYLLAFAVSHGGRLVTFDQAISPSSVRRATARHLHLL